jgi:hypothetical protein
MTLVNQSFLMDLESNMSRISEEEYATALETAWWSKVAVTKQTSTANEIVSWLISTGQFRDDGVGFESVVARHVELKAIEYLKGLEISKASVEDYAYGIRGGEAADMAAEWSRNTAAQAALLPQGLLGSLIRGGASTTLAYDGLTFFNAAHPLNPARAELGTYSNILSGAGYAIHTGTDAQIAANFAAALGQVASIKTSDGTMSRSLKVVGLLHPPALIRAAAIVTGAAFVNATDVSGFVSSYGIKPIMAPELGSGFSGGSDQSYYLVCALGSSPLGAFAHVDREKFAINMHGPEASAELARSRKLQYVASMRSNVVAGHPYGLIKVVGA